MIMTRLAGPPMLLLKTNSGTSGFLIAGSDNSLAQPAKNIPKAKEFRIERSMPKEAVACIECHKAEHPGIFADWAHSRHANTHEIIWQIDPWLKQGMNSDFERASGCFHCHGTVLKVKDGKLDSARLAWESQAPLTIRPQDFKPFPAKTNYQTERDKMKEICKQCHGKTWVDGHFVKYDQIIQEYNEVYYKPAQKMLEELYGKGLLDKTRYFDEELEVEFYELWHHEGRRARFGAVMMAPDYTWWRGFCTVAQ